MTKPTEYREYRRLRAYDLKQQGWKQKDIAVALGVTEGAVSQWLKRAREGGQAALRRHPPPGATPRLRPEQRHACANCWSGGPKLLAWKGTSGRPGALRPSSGETSESAITGHMSVALFEPSG